MHLGVAVMRGQIVRLTLPYWDAQRGLYTVEYVYRNGALSVLSHADRRRYEVPAHICRPVSVNGKDRH